MGMLNPPRALPLIGRFIYGYLLFHAKGRSEKIVRLQKLMRPDGVVRKPKDGAYPFDQTWRALRDIGLFVEKDDSLRLNPDLPPAALDRKTGESRFVRTVRELLMMPENNQEIWESNTAARELTRGLAWTLTLDIHRPLKDWNEGLDGDAAQGRQLEDFGAKERDGSGKKPSNWAISNGSRYDAFIRWAPFLGFGWIHQFGRTSLYVPDPTAAVTDTLDSVFVEVGQRRTLSGCLQSLAEAIPVLGGGWIEREVRGSFISRRDGQSNDRYVAPSLSHTLWRLHEAGVLRLVAESDTDQVFLVDHRGETTPFSHATFLGKETAHG